LSITTVNYDFHSQNTFVAVVFRVHFQWKDETSYLEGHNRDGRKIQSWILRKYIMMMWSGLKWFGIMSSGGFGVSRI